MSHAQEFMICIQTTLSLPLSNHLVQIIKVLDNLITENFIELRVNARYRNILRTFTHRSQRLRTNPQLSAGRQLDGLTFRHALRLLNQPIHRIKRQPRLALQGIKELSKNDPGLVDKTPHMHIKLNCPPQSLIQHMLKRPAKLTHQSRADDTPTALDRMERAPHIGQCFPVSRISLESS